MVPGTCVDPSLTHCPATTRVPHGLPLRASSPIPKPWQPFLDCSHLCYFVVSRMFQGCAVCGTQHSALGIDPAHCVCSLFPFLPSGVPWCPAPSLDIWVVSSVWPSLNKAAMNIHVQSLVCRLVLTLGKCQEYSC